MRRKRIGAKADLPEEHPRADLRGPGGERVLLSQPGHSIDGYVAPNWTFDTATPSGNSSMHQEQNSATSQSKPSIAAFKSSMEIGSSLAP